MGNLVLNKGLRAILLKVYPGVMNFSQDLKVKMHKSNFKIIYLLLFYNNNKNSAYKWSARKKYNSVTIKFTVLLEHIKCFTYATGVWWFCALSGHLNLPSALPLLPFPPPLLPYMYFLTPPLLSFYSSGISQVMNVPTMHRILYMLFCWNIYLTFYYTPRIFLHPLKDKTAKY